ncbi:hypothetical protein ILUMI_20347, partial [Ignelater luminosus]
MSLSASVTTVESSRLRRVTARSWTLYRFASNLEYVIITMGCTFTYHNLRGFVHVSDSEKESSLIHYILCYILIGLPLNYLQILMGQYSQLGAIFFKHMSPVGHGIGYAFLLNSFVWCCSYGMLMADFLMYCLACIDPELKWMVCPANSTQKCWDSKSDCMKDCINENVSISAYVYWKESYMQDPDFYPTHLTLGKPLFVRVVPLCICWSLIFALVSGGINKYKDIIRTNFYIGSIFILILLPVCFVTEGAGKGVEWMFYVNPASFLSVT